MTAFVISFVSTVVGICCICSNVDIHALKREAEFYCVTPLSKWTLLHPEAYSVYSKTCNS